MASVVLMPKVGISVESCIITEWLKKPGDNVAVGDILFSYETDKSSMEYESTDAGVMLEQFFGAGDEVEVLLPVCAIGEAGEDVSALRPGGTAEAAPAPQQAEPAAQPETVQAAAPQAVVTAAPQGELKISPRAKKLAQRQSVDTSMAQPTGPYGRIIERDIQKMVADGVGLLTSAAYAQGGSAAAQGTGIGGRTSIQDLASGTATPITTITGPAAEKPEYEDVKFSGIRRAISKNMTASLRDIPQLTHTFRFDATSIMAYRKAVKNNGEDMELPSITLNDIILYAVSRTLLEFPELNAHMLDETNIRYFRDVNLGMAVDTPRGLMVPVIRGANYKSLSQIAQEAKSLAKQAQDGSIHPDNLSGGTFTISNLGALGVENFTPVINPPQTGILGVNTITKMPRESKDGGIELYPTMAISLTYDHRAIDGAPASRFASRLCRVLENFALLLAR